MGDRALVVFYDKKLGRVSPTVYLHWLGEQVPALLEKHAEFMSTRKGDLDYAIARFIGICHCEIPDTNLSLGVHETPQDVKDAILNLGHTSVDVGEAANEEIEGYSHGDAGVVVVDCNTFKWEAFGGYLTK